MRRFRPDEQSCENVLQMNVEVINFIITLNEAVWREVFVAYLPVAAWKDFTHEIKRHKNSKKVIFRIFRTIFIIEPFSAFLHLIELWSYRLL